MVSWWPFSESLYDEPGDWSTTLPWLCSSCARWPLMTSACAGVITGEFKFCQPLPPTSDGAQRGGAWTAPRGWRIRCDEGK